MEEGLSQAGSGLILGKFMPPHRGHQYLVDFALNYVEDLTVIVGSLAAEPIPGELRVAWMREMFPKAKVLHLTDENPQYPHEHPDFWQIWHDSLRRLVPTGPDYLFASEEYGINLAEVLGAKFVPADLGRSLIEVSATDIRQDPMRHWEYIPETVRPYFVRRACLFGPESTGKTVLAQRLARHFKTVYVPEYARGLIKLQGDQVTPDIFPAIVRGQMASEEALARQANRVLICDTDVLTTTLWADWFYGDCPAWIREQADRHGYHLYLLADIDVPWMEDSQRFTRDSRQGFMGRCVEALESRGRRYVRIGGSWEERYNQAVKAVEELLGERGTG